VRDALTIGEFSRITHLSIRTLRRYHEQGLVEPAAVDPVSGYRSYEVAQVPTAQVIHRFRELGMPLADLREMLTIDDPDRRTTVVAEHLARLRDQLAVTTRSVDALQRLLTPTDLSDGPRIEVRTYAARSVAAVEAEVGQADVLAWYSEAMLDLSAVVPPAARTGPPGGQYAHELFTEGAGRLLVSVPAEVVVPVGRVQALRLRSREVAVISHVGPHDDIDVSYGLLGSWVAGQAVGVDGPVEEVYLVGPADDPDPASWVTEIAWPVFRTR
jgi:DNA-binding transcriptional MerR regulator